MYQTRWINRTDVSQYCITAVFISPFEMHDILIRSFFPVVYLFYDGKLFFFCLFFICFISRLKLNFLCKWRTLSKICIHSKKMGKHFFKIVVVLLFTHHNKTCDSALAECSLLESKHAKSFGYKEKVDTQNFTKI